MARKSKVEASDLVDADEVTVGEAGTPRTTALVADELWRFDSDTGELCIGNECLQTRIGRDGSFVVEMDPDSKMCTTEARERLKQVLMNAVDGRGRVRFRRRGGVHGG